MPANDSSSFETVAPVFGVADVERSRAYYTDQLGFSVEFEWKDEEEVQYVVLSKGHTGLHLSQHQNPPPTVAYFFVSGVQKYYEALQTTDAMITEQIRDYPWEMREFELKDPDGHKLIFGEHLSRIEQVKES
jgi:catechol 2,3-dioxygenase-like lactoylglutathione lyase family enzyme